MSNMQDNGIQHDESLSNCSSLMEFATPEVYRNNVFRITGLPVTATRREIRRHTQKMRLAASYGGNASSGGVLALSPPPDEHAIREAINLIENPEKRLIHEFFWFSSSTGTADQPDAGLEALRKGETAEAIQIWEKLVSDNKNAIAMHNLAILHHCLALDMETGSEERDGQQEKARPHHWDKAFHYWKMTASSRDTWDRLKERVRELDDPRLTTGLVRRMDRNFPRALLSINARLAVQAITKKQPEVSQRHLQTADLWGDSKLVNQALTTALQPIETRIRTFCKRTHELAQEEPVKALERVNELLEHTIPLLDPFDELLPEDNELRIAIHDEVATTILSCQIEYGNKTEDWEKSLEITEQALKVAMGHGAIDRIQSNKEILKGNKKRGNKWCADGYWQQPPQILERLEEARDLAEKEDYDEAIEILLSMDASLGDLIKRPVSFCLTHKGITIVNNAIHEVVSKREENEKNFLTMIFVGMTLHGNRFPDQFAQFGNPPCPKCHQSFYSSWRIFEINGNRMWVCNSCWDQHQRESSGGTDCVRKETESAIEHLLLADELSPKIQHTLDNLKTIKEGAREISGCRIPTSPKKLRKSLKKDRVSRVPYQHEPAREETKCFFCGSGEPDLQSAIVIPMNRELKNVKTLFGQATEYHEHEVEVPRCQVCHQKHTRYQESLEEWQRSYHEVQQPESYPELKQEIDACNDSISHMEALLKKNSQLDGYGEISDRYHETKSKLEEIEEGIKQQKSQITRYEEDLKIEKKKLSPVSRFFLSVFDIAFYWFLLFLLSDWIIEDVLSDLVRFYPEKHLLMVWDAIQYGLPVLITALLIIPPMVKAKRKKGEIEVSLESENETLASLKDKQVPLKEEHEQAVRDLKAAQKKAELKLKQSKRELKSHLADLEKKLADTIEQRKDEFLKMCPEPGFDDDIKSETAFHEFPVLWRFHENNWKFGKYKGDAPVVEGLVYSPDYLLKERVK